MKSDVKSVATLVAGISLCGVTGYFLYLLFKKDPDYDDYKDTISIAGMQQKIEIKIPIESVRAVIGRNGQHIREIEEKCQCKINFKNRENDEEFRLCVIRGSNKSCAYAESLIHEFLANQPVIESKDLRVPNISIGKIIGRRGENINYISQITGAKINVSDFEQSSSYTRCIQVKGTNEQIHLAVSYITDMVREDIRKREEMECKLAQREPRGKLKNDKNGTKKEKVEQTSEKLSINTVGGDGQMEVYVSAVIDPSQFWLQIVGPKANELDQLVEEMTEYYSKPENQELHVISEHSVGEIVAAVFMYDSKWYRAEIVALETVNDKQAAQLYFLDYGDTDTVPVDEIFELRTDFLRLRFQAIECYLAKVKPADEEWSSEAVDRFEEWTQAAQWKKLRARVSGYKDRDASRSNGRAKREGSPIPGVDLYDINNQEDIDIALELVRNGYAVLEDLNGAVETNSKQDTSISSTASIDENCEQLVNGNSELSSIPDTSHGAQSHNEYIAEVN